MPLLWPWVTNPDFFFHASGSLNSGYSLHKGWGAGAALPREASSPGQESGEAPPPAKHRNFQFKPLGHPRERVRTQDSYRSLSLKVAWTNYMKVDLNLLSKKTIHSIFFFFFIKSYKALIPKLDLNSCRNFQTCISCLLIKACSVTSYNNIIQRTSNKNACAVLLA